MIDDIFAYTSGPHDAKIVLVGEAWGSEEEAQQLPFVGHSGRLLRHPHDGLLALSGIDPSTVLFTNVVSARPAGNNMWNFFLPKDLSPTSPLGGLYPSPLVIEHLQRLYSLLDEVQPDLIIAAGNYPLWP